MMRYVMVLLELAMLGAAGYAAGHSPVDIEGLPAQVEAKLAVTTGKEADPFMDWCYRLSMTADQLRLMRLRGEETERMEKRLERLRGKGFELVENSEEPGRKLLILADMLQTQMAVSGSGREAKGDECEQVLQVARELLAGLTAEEVCPDEIVEAETAEFSAAKLVADETASDGKALEVTSREAQILFRLQFPAGKSQVRFSARGSGTSADSLFVQIDGGEKQSFGVQVGKYGISGSYTIEGDTAGEHEILLTMRENPPIWVDYMAYTSSAAIAADKAGPSLARAYLVLRGAQEGATAQEAAAESLLAAYAATVTTHVWHHYETKEPFWYWQTQRLLAGVFEDLPKLPERTRFRELASTAVTQAYYLGRELPKKDANTAWDKVLALAEMGEAMPLDEIVAGNLATADDSLRCQAAMWRFLRLRTEEDAEFMEQMLGDFRPGVFYDDERLAQMWERNTTDEFYMSKWQPNVAGADELMDQTPPTWQPAPDLARRTEVYDVAEYKQAGSLNRIISLYMLTGMDKYGPKAVELWLDGSVRQWEVHAAYRCYYSSSVPWDQQYRTLSAVEHFDVMEPLMSRDDKRRVLWHVREMTRELTVALAYIPLDKPQHNAHCRYCGGVGLAGSYWWALPEAPYWRELAARYRPHIHRGILGDGGWLEVTTAYHMFAAKPMVMYYMAAKKLQGEDFVTEQLEGNRIGDMLEWMVKVVTPNGGMPRFNDGGQSDPGTGYYRLHQLAHWLGNREYGFATRNTKTPAMIADYSGYTPKRPDFTSVLLPDSGIAVLRDSWEEDAYYAALDFGPHGGGHGHCDKGNFVLYADGEAWMVDSRYGWKKTEHHNTIVVDGANQEQGLGTLLKWETDEGHDAVAIYHDLYPTVRHYRSMYHERGGPFVVVDRLVPNDEAEHTYTSRLYVLGETVREGDCYVAARAGKGIAVRTGGDGWNGGDVADAEFSYQSDCRMPDAYPVYVVKWEAKGAGEQWLATVLVPHVGDKPELGEVTVRPEGSDCAVSFSLDGVAMSCIVPMPVAEGE
jgi:hypothetical protein